MCTFDHPDFDHHEIVAFKEDKASGLKAIIAVHNSNLGAAMGGCRMYNYANSQLALGDVLRLSKGMTYKSALAGIPLGGGKAVIIGDPRIIKNESLMMAMGDFIDSLGGQYITAEDSGTSVSDMASIAKRTQYVSGFIDDEEHGGDPSPITALGVYHGILASVQYRFNSDLKGARVALQGVGNVGFHLAKMLTEAGAIVSAADINPANINRAVIELGIEKIPLGHILEADVDVLAPCALGGAINNESVSTIKAKVIAGAANNQLFSKDMGEKITAQGILYAPDYVINAGGIIDVYYQTKNIRDKSTITTHVENIGETLQQIYQLAEEQKLPTNIIADQLAEQIFQPSTLNNQAA